MIYVNLCINNATHYLSQNITYITAQIIHLIIYYILLQKKYI